MRIGILTFHNADNFGCVFQCYGLQQALKMTCPDAEVEIINFERVRENPPKLMQEEQLIRTQKFEEFRNKYMNIYGNPTGDPDDIDSGRYDICVVGSDQVWNYSLVAGKEKAYFLRFAGDNTKKISYAASIGGDSLNKERQEWFRNNAQYMNAISLREESSADSIRALVDKPVSVCVDPSLLHDSAFWGKVEREPENPIGEKYLLFYALGYTWCRNEERKAAQMASEIAQEKGLRVIHYYFGQLREWMPDGSDHCFCEGPQELLWLFHHAEYVVCCSFHGTAFSVIFQRPFYTFHTPGNGNRMKDLVTSLGLADRYIENPLGKEQWNWDIPWDKVNIRLQQKREESLKYLRNEVTQRR